MSRIAGYESIVWTAVVAGVFSTIVCAVMLAQLVSQPRFLALDAPEYVAMREQLASSSGDPQIQQKLHAIDVELREAYFRQQEFTRRGSYLLGGGLAVSLLLWQVAVLMRPKLPELKPESIHDTRTQAAYHAQWASGAVVVALVLAIIGWKLGNPSALNGDLASDSGKVSVSDAAKEGPSAPIGFADAARKPPTQEEWARNWYRFRGPSGSGVSAFDDLPQSWNGATGDGVLWKTEIPLSGASSPIIWDRRVFLTGANENERFVYCFDADSGKRLWEQPVVSNAEGASRLRVETSTGFAAPTPATDGRHVYAIFATGDIAAFDFDGNRIWSRPLGLPSNPYGHAASLELWNELVIVQFDQGTKKQKASWLVALDGRTGEISWQVRRETPVSWSSPIVVEHEGQPRVITCGDPWVIAYSADTGEEIWRAKCLGGEVGPSPVYHDGVVYVAGDHASVAAIRDGGSGDVTDTHILWMSEIGLPDICSPLVTDEHVLLVASYGDLVCYDRAKGGEPLWEVALDGLLFASPSLVGDLVYLIGEQGKGWVVRATATGMEPVAENDLSEACSASPAFQQGRIYIRGKKHLFCLGRE